MAGIVVLKGPDAPATAPLGLCAVCSAIGKFEALQPLKAAVSAHESRGQGVRTWQLAVAREWLQRAVTFGLVPSMQAALPVCWSHMMALQATSGGIIPVQGGMPPGLSGNGGGIPLLGQGG